MANGFHMAAQFELQLCGTPPTHTPGRSQHSSEILAANTASDASHELPETMRSPFVLGSRGAPEIPSSAVSPSLFRKPRPPEAAAKSTDGCATQGPLEIVSVKVYIVWPGFSVVLSNARLPSQLTLPERDPR